MLFNTTYINNISSEMLYFRSDDVPRTLMSGQTLLSTMFDTNDDIIIPWHTGDDDLDQIHPNTNACPRLKTVSKAALASTNWTSYSTSPNVVNMTNQLNSIFGKGAWSWTDNLDCMMSTVCTGRQIPTRTSNDTGSVQ